MANLAFWPQTAFGIAAELFPNDTARGLQGMERGLRANMQLRLLLGLERWDRHGSTRRVGGYLHERVDGIRELLCGPEIFYEISPVRELLSPML